jgi:hypothetical protein
MTPIAHTDVPDRAVGVLRIGDLERLQVVMESRDLTPPLITALR